MKTSHPRFSCGNRCGYLILTIIRLQWFQIRESLISTFCSAKQLSQAGSMAVLV